MLLLVGLLPSMHAAPVPGTSFRLVSVVSKLTEPEKRLDLANRSPSSLTERDHSSKVPIPEAHHFADAYVNSETSD